MIRNSKKYNSLLNEGPQYFDYTGNLKRMDGVRKFNRRPSSKGSSVGGNGHTKTVLYIEGKHSPQKVIEKWLDVNDIDPDEANRASLHYIISRHGDEFNKASKEIISLDRSDRGGHVDGRYDKECPFCEKSISLIPAHLRSGCEEA